MDLHLVDGTYELFRAHYGAPRRTNRAGREIGATRGLLRSLAALLREPGVTHVAVAFDHVIESFRNELFDGYKTGAGIEAELRAQFELAETAAESLGVVVWPMVEFEADDALATAAAQLGVDGGRSPFARIYLCSPDKDLAQCVRGSSTLLCDRRRSLTLGEAEVIAKWGVPPASIPDLLALMGDSADGIPGIPRWGARSSAALLAAYGHIESIPAEPTRWEVKVRGAARLSQELERARPEAMLYRRLATLRTDLPLAGHGGAALGPESLAWRGVRPEALARICEQVEDPGLLERMAAA